MNNFKWVKVVCERKIIDKLRSQDFKRKISITTTNYEGEQIDAEYKAPKREKEIIKKELEERLILD